MIPISVATVIEGMFMQLPQVDFTFGIGDIVGSIALIITGITFYISHTRASQSEQVKTSRDLWDRITRVHDKYEDIWKINEDDANKDEVLSPVFVEIDYFAYLIVKGELKDRLVFEYYGEKLKRIITTLLDRYRPEFNQYRKTNKYINLRKLIIRWNIEVPE